MAGQLALLLDYLDGLTARPDLAELESALQRAAVAWSDVAHFLRFAPRSYRRNLVRGRPLYNLWVLCWLPGQHSPIHDHASSACGIRVLRGTATITTYS